MSKQNWKAGNMVYPLPAVMVSCGRPDEKPNIITVAWCGTVCTNPAMVSISVRPERYSYDILKETGEFVINLTTEELNRAADYCGVRSGRDVDKFAEMHLTPEPSEHIQAPGIAESPVNIECRVTQILPLGSHHMFLAEVMGVRVDESLLNERGSLQLGKAKLTTYSHGIYYSLGEELGTFGYSVKKPAAVKGAAGAKNSAGNKKSDNTEKSVGDKKSEAGKTDKKASAKFSERKKEKQGSSTGAFARKKKADAGEKKGRMGMSSHRGSRPDNNRNQKGKQS